jgi:hypothetical protein
MKLVLLEIAFIALAVVKVLNALTVKHAILPAPFILFGSGLTVEDTQTALDTILEIPFIPAAIRPPESPSAVSFARLELALIQIRLLTRPPIHTAALLLIKLELAHIIVPRGKV